MVAYHHIDGIGHQIRKATVLLLSLFLFNAGTATVDLKEILNNEQDIIQTNIDVLSRPIETKKPIAIGQLNVSVEVYEALKSIVVEVPQFLFDKSLK